MEVHIFERVTLTCFCVIFPEHLELLLTVALLINKLGHSEHKTGQANWPPPLARSVLSIVTSQPLPPSGFPWQPGVCKRGMETSNTWWVFISYKKPTCGATMENRSSEDRNISSKYHSKEMLLTLHSESKISYWSHGEMAGLQIVLREKT